jgi:predicted lipoprotein with Yx(FWY)xxD motif
VNVVSRRLAGRRVAAVGLVILMAGAGLAITEAASAASTHAAAAAAAKTSKAATVVQEHTRGHFGKILTTVKGRALYYIPSNSCNSECLSIWPALLMPKGKTIPKGATCLSTAKFGRHGLQVTYDKHRLYTFVSDSGTSVTGNGVEGFKVAKVVRCG